MAVADDLEAAARIIGEMGWKPGWASRHDEDGVCLMRALGLATSDATVNEAYEMVLAVLPEGPGRGAAAWNDEAGRTKEEVVSVLLKAAERARAS